MKSSPISIGDTASFTRIFTQADFDGFAALSGDDNPIHVDPQFAQRTKFGRTVAHGMFLYANIVRLTGELLPGALQVEQELLFPAPTFTDELVEVRLECTGFPAEGFAELVTTTLRADGTPGSQGRSRVRLPGWITAPLPEELATPQALPQPGGDFKGLAVGQSAELLRSFSRRDLETYAALTGETNPLFTDPSYARRAGLSDTPLPGPLLGALFSCLLGTRLPGRGTNWLKQRLFFPAPAYPGEELHAQVAIVRLRPEKELANLRTWATNPAGKVVCDGEALVLASDLEKSTYQENRNA